MMDLKTIPDGVKWRLAADCAAKLPAMYDLAFRRVVGDRYDEIEQEIWMELSRTVSDIARELSLPARNAQELAETIRTVQVILFGPEYKSESLEVSKDGAVIIVRHCPFLDRGFNVTRTTELTFHKCLALTLTAVPLLNKNYTARYVRTMCTGDRQCEIKIEISHPQVETSTVKK
jgi:predicted ArsR family transcriptional regulator